MQNYDESLHLTEGTFYTILAILYLTKKIYNYELYIPSKKEKKGKYPRFFKKKKNKNRQAGAPKQTQERPKKNSSIIRCFPE